MERTPSLPCLAPEVLRNEPVQKTAQGILFSPSDLIRFYQSPFASWMDRWHFEGKCTEKPDEDSEEQKLLAQTGDRHEKATLEELKKKQSVREIEKNRGFAVAQEATLKALKDKAPVIFQAALSDGIFAGYADFLFLRDQYEVWDTKLAKSPKPYYVIQLCCYTEMLAQALGEKKSKRFGVILGDSREDTLLTEDFFYLYQNLREKFLNMHVGFDGDPAKRPPPLPRSEHGRWTSLADKLLRTSDSLVMVAGINVAQIRKLEKEGIQTLTALAEAKSATGKINKQSFSKIQSQARLQHETRQRREKKTDHPPIFEVLPTKDGEGRPCGLATLPPQHSEDIYFDMEGYPLVPGGLEYLFGAECKKEFSSWWAHDRAGEKKAFQEFVRWAYEKWKRDPGLHIYHYANYEVAALRRLDNRHETCQKEMRELLSQGAFIDLYRVVREGLRVGEESYSIKKIESLYREKRKTDVATALDSIVHYANWLESGEGRDPATSRLLKGIRDYNEDDCRSTRELTEWLRTIIQKNNIGFQPPAGLEKDKNAEDKTIPPEVIARLETIKKLEQDNSPASKTLAHLLNFHRREEQPVWWRMFNRAASDTEEIRADSGCIQGLKAEGSPQPEKQSLVHKYTFDPEQESKLKGGDGSRVRFCHNISATLELKDLDLDEGTMALKISQKKLNEAFGGNFPLKGSVLDVENVPATPIQLALTEVGQDQLNGTLPEATRALLERTPPNARIRMPEESIADAALRVTRKMNGGCFVIQGPPGTGKTHTGAMVIAELLAEGKMIGITSNSHKAINHLLAGVGQRTTLKGIKVESERDEGLYQKNPSLEHVASNKQGWNKYQKGIAGGTAWLFSEPDWKDKLDYLFIDEAGQFSLANAVAVSRAAKNLVLLGDQMQLEHPVQGSHPVPAGLSVLQYVLLDEKNSGEDEAVVHPVVPETLGLFLDETHRLPAPICGFISESIYHGKLKAAPACEKNCLVDPPQGQLIQQTNGIVYLPIEHEGNIQKSREEADRAKEVFEELLGKRVRIGEKERELAVEDFLFISPYNSQVRHLKSVLGPEARVGSVDKFQGQQAPICVLSMCSSFGEYGHRGLGFILDKNRINVALSRAQVLAVVIADPRIGETPTQSLNEMSLLNLFIKITKGSG